LSTAIPLAAKNGHARRRQETAARIVLAAGTLFAERGVSETTVADICARADVARQTFFNHFATKQDLVAALVQVGVDFFEAAVDTAIRTGSGTRERLERLFAQIHEAASSAGPMHHELVSEVMRAAHQTALPQQIRVADRAVAKLLRAGRARGDVSREHALEDQVALVQGAFHHLQLEWTQRKDFPIAARSTRMARMLADALAPR
jgi:AcrR family transcriptional regulator